MGRKSEVWWWKDRQGWYSTIDGKRVKLGQGRAAKKAAEQKLRKLLATQGQPGGSDPDEHSLEWLAGRFLDMARRKLAPATTTFYTNYLKTLCDLYGREPAGSIKPHHIESWMNGRKWNASTKSGAVRTAKRIYRWARKQGYLAVDPMIDLEKPRAETRDKIMTEDQFSAILAKAKDRCWRDFLTALWETGCRPREVATVTAADVDLEVGIWKVANKTRHKTTPTRTIHLTPTMVDMTRRLAVDHPSGPLFLNRRGRPWERRTIAARFFRVRERLGYGPEATAYSLRHLYVTDALDKGVPIATVAELVGHTSTTMIMKVYSKLRDRTDHLRKAAELVRPTSPSVDRSDHSPESIAPA